MPAHALFGACSLLALMTHDTFGRFPVAASVENWDRGTTFAQSDASFLIGDSASVTLCTFSPLVASEYTRHVSPFCDSRLGMPWNWKHGKSSDPVPPENGRIWT